jgi:hypothetical protein
MVARFVVVRRPLKDSVGNCRMETPRRRMYIGGDAIQFGVGLLSKHSSYEMRCRMK